MSTRSCTHCGLTVERGDRCACQPVHLDYLQSRVMRSCGYCGAALEENETCFCRRKEANVHVDVYNRALAEASAIARAAVEDAHEGWKQIAEEIARRIEARMEREERG